MTKSLNVLDQRRLPALAATLALHVALVLLWQVARQQPKVAPDDGQWIQWVNVAPARRPAPPLPAAAAKPPVEKIAKAPAVRPQAVAPAAPVEAPAAPIEEAVVAAAPAPSADGVMARARRDLAGIDKELREEFPEARIKAPRDTPQARLEKGFDLAAEMAPPRWYEQAKIKEIIDPGGYGRRRYRVITAYGTYCVTYESNHAPDGIDTMQKGIQPKMSNCPKDEQPATTQKIPLIKLGGGKRSKPPGR